jgi:hypothetical protein
MNNFNKRSKYLVNNKGVAKFSITDEKINSLTREIKLLLKHLKDCEKMILTNTENLKESVENINKISVKNTYEIIDGKLVTNKKE